LFWRFFLQPQDYELAVTALNNGSMFTASYMQNMLLPMGGVMHRVSMGVQAMLIGWSSAPRPTGCTSIRLGVITYRLAGMFS
jgi:hypothetical protein